MSTVFEKINPKSNSLTLQTIFDRVSSGYKLQELQEESLTKEQISEFNDAIILSPDYQREYRSTTADESSLVESVLLGIPIPPIFLASHKFKGVQVLNVVDGQHRLRAFYRYFSGLFKLSDLKILGDFNGSFYNDLEIEYMTSLQSGDISAITFRDFPGKDFELEIFNRYNKGTKPLTAQEIRHAVYDSKINRLVNDFCKMLINNQKSTLSKAYAVSKDRYQKKMCQENIFVILSILEYGVNQSYALDDSGKEQKLVKSPHYAESYMKRKSLLEKTDDESAVSGLILTQQLFNGFNNFIEKLAGITEFPFSREIYGVSSRGNKFQVSISMILAGIYNKLHACNYNFSLLNNQVNLFEVKQKILSLLMSSYLEDPDYKASSTNPVEIKKLIDRYIV